MRRRELMVRGLVKMVVQKRTLTADEFAQIEDLPENADRILELIEGEIVEKVPSFEPSRIAARIIMLFGTYLLPNEIGYVTGADGGHRISDGDVLNPDVGYISKK